MLWYGYNFIEPWGGCHEHHRCGRAEGWRGENHPEPMPCSGGAASGDGRSHHRHGPTEINRRVGQPARGGQIDAPAVLPLGSRSLRQVVSDLQKHGATFIVIDT